MSEPSPVGLETHGLGAKLLWADHGLDPYWGVVSVYDPEHVDGLDGFEAVGDTWTVASANHWEGQIAPPEGQDHIDGGMYEYSYTLAAEDDAGDKDVVIQFRPAFPNAENVHSGEPMQGIPDDLPWGIRVQVMSTNVTAPEALSVLRSFADAIGLNTDYFGGEPHEWSRAYQYERYGRLVRKVAENHLTGAGGMIDQLADFASDQRGRGEYKWNNEEIVGHYQSVAIDPDTWAMLLPDDEQHGKRCKCYHPANPRSSTDGDDPLAHPKLEISLSNEYDPTGHVRWSALDELRDELDAAAYNVLRWAGVPLSPDSGTWVDSDPYFDVDDCERAVETVPNPLPELRDETEKHVESELIRTDLSETKERLLTVLTDGGRMHYEELADEADAGTSTVYRLVDDLGSLLGTDNGIVDFADDVTRRHVETIISQVRDTAEWASQSIRQVAEEYDILTDADDPLRQWMDRYGVEIIETHPELEFEFGRRVSEVTIRQILRAGLDAAEASGMLTRRFEDARITWVDRDGETRPARRVQPLAHDSYKFLR